MAFLALSPVMVALAAKLNVGALTALATGGVHDDVPQDNALPLVWIKCREPRDERGMGTGGFPEIDIRVHVFSDYEGTKELQQIIAKVIELLKDQALTVVGYAQAGLVFYDGVSLPNDVVFHGRKCREMVAFFRTYVEES